MLHGFWSETISPAGDLEETFGLGSRAYGYSEMLGKEGDCVQGIALDDINVHGNGRAAQLFKNGRPPGNPCTIGCFQGRNAELARQLPSHGRPGTFHSPR